MKLGALALIAVLLASSTVIVLFAVGEDVDASGFTTDRAVRYKGSSSVTCVMDSSSVEVGTTAHATGVLKATSYGGTVVLKRTVVSLSVILPDGTKVSPAQGARTTTASDGSFSIDYTPQIAGEYTFKVTYSGSRYYSGSSATATFTAVSASEPGDPGTPTDPTTPTDPPTDPTTPTTPTTYNYAVSPSAVKDPSGNVVFTGTAMQCIQHALSITPVGGTVYLEPGTYSISSYLFVDRSLIGSGTDTKLVADGSNYMFMMRVGGQDGSAVDGLTISNMELNGQGSRFPSAQYGGIQTAFATNCVFENLYIHDVPFAYGIDLEASSYNTVRDCVVANIGYNQQWASGICSGDMIDDTTSSFNLVERCTITGCSMAGIDWEPGNNNIVRDTSISGLTSWNGGPTVGISMWNQPGHPASNNNQFINVKVDYAGVNIISNEVSGTVIQGCTLTGSESSAIYTTACSNWVVKDCAIRTNGGHGVFFDLSTGNTVTGCTIEDASHAYVGYTCGVLMTSDANHPSKGNTVSGNQISYMIRAIEFGAYTTSSTVTNNVETACTYGDYIPGTPNTIG